MISLRNVCVHNLKNIDIDLPKKQIIVFCGRSGSGKTSLAVDTLYAEGQRRYIETFSPAMRQFLEKIEKPDVEHISGIPPAVAVGQQELEHNDKATVGEATEITYYLTQILQKSGHIFCQKCRSEIIIDTPESIGTYLETLHLERQLAESRSVLIAFEPPLEESAALFAEIWKEQGFLRVMYQDTVFRLDEPFPPNLYKNGLLVIVDRISVKAENRDRIIESLETAMEFGSGICCVQETESIQETPATSAASRGFLSRKKFSNRFTCEACDVHSSSPLVERRLNADIHSLGINELSAMTVEQIAEHLRAESFTQGQYQRIKYDWEQVLSRCGYLQQTGLGMLTLDRQVSALTYSERRRVALTAALASPLVDMLYVLDEPSLGLTKEQTEKLLDFVRQLRDRGNTVILIDHHPVLLLAADHLVEFGPGAGTDGGRIVFQGTVEEILNDEKSLTGTYLKKMKSAVTDKREKIEGLSIGIDCRTNKQSALPVPASSLPRSSASNSVTYLQIFDEIRRVFADTADAKAKNITVRHFSFNVPAGRCEHCKGCGIITVNMQFLSDQIIRCSECKGKRYQPQVLEILYRGKTISDVLNMTVREAFVFFRGQNKIQKGLMRLLDTGLDYIQIGQSVNTLSGGELQRLKLAAYLLGLKGSRETIYLDEPTAGLHFADVDALLDCFRQLVQSGHKIIVNSHNEQLLAAIA
ncbi:MAG: AAA family ATPase [Planctomycetaceae bacterium]|jgi:excinuclease ABC subunit A|nr:AAA family ATPase [Planctomycetaceae bacterium]